MISRAAAAALAALVLAAAAGARPGVDPGVTATSVLLGGTVPLTGEAAAFGAVGAGARAYFDYANAKGGVHGRTISYRTYDDAYNPAQTVQLTRKLVEQDQVFAVFNSVGTANNLAIREYLNARKVPQLFAGDGSRAIGTGFARYPWTMGFLMSYRGEGDVYRKTLVQSRPRARVAVLYENTELGRDMLSGLTRAEGGTDPDAGRTSPRRAESRSPGESLPASRRLQTSRTDYRPLEHVYLYRYDNREWVKASKLLHARG